MAACASGRALECLRDCARGAGSANGGKEGAGACGLWSGGRGMQADNIERWIPSVAMHH
jgi:hypothetical protein